MAKDELKVKDLCFQLVLTLSSTLRSIQMYPNTTHPVIKKNEKLTFDLVSEIIDKSSDFSLDFLDSEVYIMNRPVVENIVVAANLYREMERRKIASITFIAGLRFEELSIFLEEAAKTKDSFGPKLLNSLGVYHIKLTAVTDELSIGEDEEDDSVWSKLNKKRERVREKYYQLCAHLRTLHQHINIGKECSSSLPNREIKVLKREADICLTFMQNTPFLLVGEVLQPILEFDPYTHPVNTAIFSNFLARKFNLKKTRQKELFLSALLHQVGSYNKETVPDSYSFDSLFVPQGTFPINSLNGARYFCGSSGVPTLAMGLAFKQYLPEGRAFIPDGSPGINSTNLFQLFLYASKIYDIGIRIWRKTGSFKLEELPLFLLENPKLDPTIKSLLKALINILSIFPPGCYVKLNTSEIARVLQPQKDYPLEPKVEIVYNQFGEKFEEPIVKRIGLDSLYGIIPRKICSTIKIA